MTNPSEEGQEAHRSRTLAQKLDDALSRPLTSQELEIAGYEVDAQRRYGLVMMDKWPLHQKLSAANEKAEQNALTPEEMEDVSRQIEEYVSQQAKLPQQELTVILAGVHWSKSKTSARPPDLNLAP